MLDLFKNPIDKKKFDSTNEIWNKMHFNSPVKIGYTSKLVKEKKFSDKLDWANFYFESGEKRKELLKLNPYDKNINLNYGRTKKEIAKIGCYLYKHLLETGNPLKLTKEECMLTAYFRIIGETWNGIIWRESNTKDVLSKKITNLGYEVSLIDTPSDFDVLFAVDYEIYFKGSIVCGIQIKPKSYSTNNSYLNKTIKLNEEKNQKYKKRFNRDVYYVYAETSGIILNENVIPKIIKDIKSNQINFFN
ncbi:TPA: MjaI family restriction endonuclease [Clostridioides difficile]|nr:MjaI family restriction endonuclease [Clostridioides difficile]